MKEYDKALQTYETGLKHDPDNEELKDGIMRCMEAISKVRWEHGI
jgi:stress-induced-phosphoprotein 1